MSNEKTPDGDGSELGNLLDGLLVVARVLALILLWIVWRHGN